MRFHNYVCLIAMLGIRSCKMRELCQESEFMCEGTWKCISKEHVCDGHRDCEDGSDETTNLCKFRSCSRSFEHSSPLEVFGIVSSQNYRCSYGGCISAVLKCNGVKDCFDGSDETAELCRSQRCASNQFQCDYGGCVSKFKRCNGGVDCVDRSDETESLCLKLRKRCRKFYFRCNYGGCIHHSKKCDGKANCADESDESTAVCGPNHNFQSSKSPTKSSTEKAPDIKISTAFTTTGKTPTKPIDTTVPTTKKSPSTASDSSETTTIASVVKSTIESTPSILAPDSILSLALASDFNIENILGNIFNTTDSPPTPLATSTHKSPTAAATAVTKPSGTVGSSKIPQTEKTINITEDPTETGDTFAVCPIPKTQFVHVEVLECGSNFNFMEINQEFHRKISSCGYDEEVPKHTLVYVDCWGKSFGVYKCKSDGRWLPNDVTYGTMPQDELCQPRGINGAVCGKLPLIKRKNDEEEEEEEFNWPFMVGFLELGEFFCSGILISPQWVLTAAHCVHRFGQRNLKAPNNILRLSLYHVLSRDMNNTVEVSSVFINPNFTISPKYTNDIALVKLAEPLLLSGELVPACLSNCHQEEETIFADNGAVFIHETKKEKIKWNVMSQTLDTSCFNRENRCSHHLEISGEQFCGKSFNKESTLKLVRGSSGGPYLVNSGGDHDEKWTVVGILSHSYHTSGCNPRSVFTSVCYHLEWITGCVEKGFC